MSDKHEDLLAEAFGGKKTRGSGNQWANQTDGRTNRHNIPFAFAWDGKSTRHASTTVSRADLAKVTEQADGDRPILALRFYDDDRLRGFEDWLCVRLDDLVEMLMFIDVTLGDYGILQEALATRLAVCKTCEKPIGWVACPTGGWWSHKEHPEDDHDAEPLLEGMD